MNTSQLLKMLLDWTKTQLAEKLKPSSKEKSVEKLAIKEIRAILASYAPRYAETVQVQEVYDKISAVIDAKASADGPLTNRQPFQPNPITAKYVSKYVSAIIGTSWAWPGIVGPSDLWFSSLPPFSALHVVFDRIQSWQKGQKGDIVVLDNRIGGGYGATGILVEDKGDTIRLYVDDITTLQYRILGKAAVLGYFRPKSPQNL